MTIVPELILEQVISGLLSGSFYIMLSLGLSLIFSLGGVVTGGGSLHRRHHRTAVPLQALRQRSGARPAVHVRLSDGGRADTAHAVGPLRPAILDSRCAAWSAACGRFHLFVLSTHDPRGHGRRGDRLLAAAQQDRFRYGGPRG